MSKYTVTTSEGKTSIEADSYSRAYSNAGTSDTYDFYVHKEVGEWFTRRWFGTTVRHARYGTEMVASISNVSFVRKEAE